MNAEQIIWKSLGFSIFIDGIHYIANRVNKFSHNFEIYFNSSYGRKEFALKAKYEDVKVINQSDDSAVLEIDNHKVNCQFPREYL